MIVGFLAIFSSIGTAQSTETDYTKSSVPELIDALTAINYQAPGLDGSDMYDGFIADSSPGHFQMGLLGVAPPKVPPQMRELVRRGAAALPDLLAHLDDKRPIALVVGNSEGSNFTYMFMDFSDEYIPRDLQALLDRKAQMQEYIKCVPPNTITIPKECQSKLPPKLTHEKPFTGSYKVKVGDVCFVVIGQIVNRPASAVRYQPTGGLIVNSPIEMPDLAEKVRKDWAYLDREGLKAALFSDIHLKGGEPNPLAFSALQRLRFYYPETYVALQGDDLEKKKAFEADEAKQRAQAK